MFLPFLIKNKNLKKKWNDGQDLKSVAQFNGRIYKEELFV